MTGWWSVRLSRVIALIGVAVMTAFMTPGLRAQQPQEAIPAPRFDIQRFEVVGNTLLPPADVERLVAPYTGTGKDFADVQRALETLEQAYRDLGYGVVQVLLPEQDITRGVVRLRVVQPRLGQVRIDGNTHFDPENIRRSLPTVKEGETPNLKAIARNLQMLSEHPVKQSNVLLRSGSSDEEIDATIKITDDKPWRGFFTLDDTGTSDTGYLRAGFGYQHSNLFNRDHSATLQFITSPSHPSDVTIFGAGYRIPFYDRNSSLDLIAGYSDVNSGVVQNLFNVSGSGTIAAVRWNYFLPKWRDVEQKVAFGLDYRAYRNEVLLAGQPLVPDITIHPASVTYSGLWRMTAAELSFYAGAATNIPGGNDGQSDDFERSRATATENYTLARYGFNYTRQFRSEWQTRVGFSAQYTEDALVAGEQFGIGGPDSVRGYQLREVAGDRGMSSQIEIYTPDMARQVGLSESYKARLLAFYDWGQVKRSNWRPIDGVQRDSIASAGIGLRMGYGKSVSVRLDLAQILQESASRDNAGSPRLTGSLAIVY